MEITVGRTVHYILSQSDCEQINRRRTTGNAIHERIKEDKWPLGAQAHIGNTASPGDVVPGLCEACYRGEPIDAKTELAGGSAYFVSLAPGRPSHDVRGAAAEALFREMTGK